MRLIKYGLMSLVILLSGCSVLQFLPPRIVNHSPPALSISMAAFEQAGCVAANYGRWTCPDPSPLAAFGCTEIEQPSSLYGALEPAYPVAVCLAAPSPSEDESFSGRLEAIKAEGYLYRRGCLLPVFARLIVWRDGEFQLLKTKEEVQAVFAPITSADEALSYALAVTGFSAYYGQQFTPGYRYLSRRVEDTFVRETGTGFEAHLFKYQLCGCGPHETFSIDVQVSRNGLVTPGDYVPIYADPTEDGLCVD